MSRNRRPVQTRRATAPGATKTKQRAPRARPRPKRTVTFICGIAKGGTGKTMLALHLAWVAQLRGWRVLFVDTDSQGDGFRRLGGDDENREPFRWAPGCEAYASPTTYDVEAIANDFDLIIIDTPPHLGLPPGKPQADLVLLPIDGFDAAFDARETIADLPEGAEGWIVLNKTGLAGKRHARILDQLEQQCPPGVAISALRVPLGGDIARVDWTRKPAWDDGHGGKAGIALRKWCDLVLDWSVEKLY